MSGTDTVYRSTGLKSFDDMKFIACVDDDDVDNGDDKKNIEIDCTKERMNKKMKLIKLRSLQRMINCTNTQACHKQSSTSTLSSFSGPASDYFRLV